MSDPVTNIPVARSPLPPMARGAGLTHRGMVRAKNEDSILTDPAGKLWAVADGMGGYDHGEIASEIVIDHLAQADDDSASPLDELVACLTRANAAVMAHARQGGIGTMGATVVALMIQRATAYVAWAGDSRAYLWRQDRLRMLTRDHTVVQGLVDAGHLSDDDAENHPESHIVTRAVGGGDTIEVDTVSQPLLPGDRLLLCSDGLPRAIFQSAIEDHLRAAPTPEEACNALVRDALANGAPDNVSVIVVDLGEA